MLASCEDCIFSLDLAGRLRQADTLLSTPSPSLNPSPNLKPSPSPSQANTPLSRLFGTVDEAAARKLPYTEWLAREGEAGRELARDVAHVMAGREPHGTTRTGVALPHAPGEAPHLVNYKVTP